MQDDLLFDNAVLDANFGPVEPSQSSSGRTRPRPADWQSHVVELQLDHQGIRELRKLDALTSLKRASFCDNGLSSIGAG